MKQPQYNSDSKNILWVDADQHDLQLMQEVLQVYRSDYYIQAVNGVDTALAYLQGVRQQRAHPCLIVQELELDDRATYTPLKQYATANHIPLIIVTAAVDTAGSSFGEHDGITLLPKPSTYSTLKQTIQIILHFCDRDY